jgi:hypothetical protein
LRSRTWPASPTPQLTQPTGTGSLSHALSSPLPDQPEISSEALEPTRPFDDSNAADKIILGLALPQVIGIGAGVIVAIVVVAAVVFCIAKRRKPSVDENHDEKVVVCELELL